jgi:hypothetical protein
LAAKHACGLAKESSGEGLYGPHRSGTFKKWQLSVNVANVPSDLVVIGYSQSGECELREIWGICGS